MTAVVTILVSRFPGYVTPGALPMLPELVSIHVKVGGGFLLYRWFDGDEHLEQSAPEVHESLEDALLQVPSGYESVSCPEDFAYLVYRRSSGQR